jgi:hypothetical protein
MDDIVKENLRYDIEEMEETRRIRFGIEWFPMVRDEVRGETVREEGEALVIEAAVALLDEDELLKLQKHEETIIQIIKERHDLA